MGGIHTYRSINLHKTINLFFLRYKHRSGYAMTLLVAAAQLARELPTAFTFVLINYAKNQISAEMDHLS